MLRGRDVAIIGVLALLAFHFKDAGAVVLSSDDDFTKFDKLFRFYGPRFGVPWRWLKAVCIVESNLGRAKSVALGLAEPNNIDDSISSDKKSWGLMQLTLATARGLEGMIVTAPYLNDADNSVRLAAKLLKELIGRFGINDRESVIRAYNGGPNFKNTVAGQAWTPAYYLKFLAALQVVMSKQPGNEYE